MDVFIIVDNDTDTTTKVISDEKEYRRHRILPRPKKIPPDGSIPYSDAVELFNIDYGLETLFKACSKHVVGAGTSIIDPVALLKEVATYIHTITKLILPHDGCSNVDEDMKKMPFKYNNHHRNNEEFVGRVISCPHYSGIVSKLYGGIFSCHSKKTAGENANDADKGFTKQITDVDLLCVFVAMVALRGPRIKEENATESANRKKLFCLIFESLRTMKDLFKDEWKNWPFTHLSGGNETRDKRIFDALFGFDLYDGRKNNWVSVSEAFTDFSQKRDFKSLQSHIKNMYNSDDKDSGNVTVYVGRPIYDMFQFLPPEAHELLFGEKLANILRICYSYSVSNMPYVLASDTHPVIADDFPPIVPSGCGVHSSSSLLSTNNMTLVSRHAIPSARKLGVYLLNRELPYSPYLGMGRAVAECMVHSSINDERAVIKCPESEMKCLDRHISKLFTRNNTNTDERCGLCDKKLNFEKVCENEASGSGLDYFPLHAFMDTCETVNRNCSASLCPDCVIRTVLFTYEKVSSGSVAISDAFRCPCCGEYMINWLGRGYEIHNLSRKLFFNSYTEFMLRYHLVNRIETCFSSLEMLQNDFMCTASSSNCLPSKESMLFISERALRPPVPRYKLKESNISARYSLNCVQCVSPLCCDRPDEYLDFETVDVVPPLIPYDPYRLDVEDAEFDEDNDELVRYDDEPGIHRWPAKLSCGFVSSNRTQNDKEIETCAEAIALLGRIPQKKRRGWNIESPEGEAIIALANWYKKNRPPENMEQLLTDVSSIFKTEDCLCIKAAHHPFLPVRAIDDGAVSQITVSENPLVAAYFKNKNCDDEQLMEYAGLFTRNLISECLLQMPECVYHRASSFVLTVADPRIIGGMRPDEAAKLDYVRSLNMTRRNMAMEDSESFSVFYTARQERTVEWVVEKGGEQLKTVSCFNCKTPAIKKGGCVTMICGACHKPYCWLCEKPIQNPDHMLIEHGLLYSTSTIARKVFENLYNVEIATLQLHKFESVDTYIMEDGFIFDVNRNRAVRKKLRQQPENISE